MGQDGEVVLVSDTALELVGVERGPQAPRRILELISPIDAAAPGPGYRAFAEAVAGGGPATGLAVECRGPFGVPRTLTVDVEPLRAAAGQPGRYLGVTFADAAAGRWHREALSILQASARLLVRARSEAELQQSLVELVVRDGGYALSWIGFGRADRTVQTTAVAGIEGYVTPGFVTWAEGDPRGDGPTGRALRTRTEQACNDVANDPRFAPWRERALAAGLRSSYVVPFQAAPGEVGMLAVYASEPDGFDRRVRSLFGLLAEGLGFGLQALRARQERHVAAARFNALLQTAGLPALVFGPGGAVEHQSPALTDLLGGRAFDPGLLHPDDRQELDQLIAEGVLPAQERTLGVRLADGRGGWRNVLSTSVPYRHARGATGSVVVLSDLTPELERQAHLATAARLDAIAALANGVAHDVRNLLLVVTTSAELLRSETALEDAEIARTLNDAAREANALLRKLVAVGAEPLARTEAVDLADAAAEVARLIGPALGPGHRIAVSQPAGRRAIALIDPNALQRALVNLVVNADDALGDAPGSVELRVLADGAGRVGVAVADTGCGIPADVLERMWEPFWTTKADGTGLGLPSARSVVEAAGGTIAVESGVGSGTTFTLWLPEAAA